MFKLLNIMYVQIYEGKESSIYLKFSITADRRSTFGKCCFSFPHKFEPSGPWPLLKKILNVCSDLETLVGLLIQFIYYCYIILNSHRFDNNNNYYQFCYALAVNGRSHDMIRQHHHLGAPVPIPS